MLVSQRRGDDGWSGKRVTPLLAGLAEVLPWVRQWHAEVDPVYGAPPADIYDGFLDSQLAELHLSRAQLAAWRPTGRVDVAPMPRRSTPRAAPTGEPAVPTRVESADAHRAIPIVSFIARQRDLRELMGAGRTGAESMSFQDQLSYWDGRFFTVTLEDRNLELIAEKRILKPVDDAAAERLAEAFRRTDNLPGATRGVPTTAWSRRCCSPRWHPTYRRCGE